MESCMQIDNARRKTDYHRQEALSRRAQTSTQFFRKLGSSLKPPPGTAAGNSTASPRSKDSIRMVAVPKARVSRPAHSSAFLTAPTTPFTEKPANHIELVN